MLSRADADLVRRDSGLPGLSTLLDPDAFVDALGPFLPKAATTACVTPVRYKPLKSCLVAYHLNVAGAPLELYAKATPAAPRQELREADGVPSVWALTETRRIKLANRAITVSILPN